MEPKPSSLLSAVPQGSDISLQLAIVKRDFPDIYKMFIEADEDRIMYKKNEHQYRRYMERQIIQDIEKIIPKNLSLELSLLFKARSFMSGDFCYASKYVDEKFLVWLGDSISHGTGSSIVKNIINDQVQKAFTLFKNKKDYSLSALIQRVQTGFSSPKTVRAILDSDLSDIITGNDIDSKMAILIPILFVQIEAAAHDQIRLRICNRGMPFALILRLDHITGRLKQGLFCARQDTITYSGSHKNKIKLVDHSGVPLILDRELFNTYTQQEMKKKELPLTDENILNHIFPVYDIYAQPGDLIIVPSDGVTEMVNYNGEEYGVNRFVDDLVNKLEHPEIYNLGLNVFKENFYHYTLKAYTLWDERYPVSGHGIEDDQTILFIKVKKPPLPSAH
jgi:hypothetical protein